MDQCTFAYTFPLAPVPPVPQADQPSWQAYINAEDYKQAEQDHAAILDRLPRLLSKAAAVQRKRLSTIQAEIRQEAAQIAHHERSRWAPYRRHGQTAAAWVRQTGRFTHDDQTIPLSQWWVYWLAPERR